MQFLFLEGDFFDLFGFGEVVPSGVGVQLLVEIVMLGGELAERRAAESVLDEPDVAVGAGSQRADPATGAVTTYSGGLNGAFTLFGGIALGGDGNVWFTSYYDGLIGRITPAGTITEFAGVAPNTQLNAITAGPQIAGSNTLWVTDPTNKSIAKLTLRCATPFVMPIT